MKATKVVIWSLGLLALGCAPTESPGTGTGGSSSTGSAGATGAAGSSTTGNAGAAGTAGSSATGSAGTGGAAGSSATGSAGTMGAAGSSTTGSAGNGSAGAAGAAGSSATGSAGAIGTAGTGGSAGTTGRGGTTGSAGSSGGAAGRGGTTGAAGATGTAGTTGRGGTTGTAGATGTGGAPVTVSSTCKTPAWPTASGSVTISGTMSVTNYDGGMKTVQGTLDDCSSGAQGSTDAIFEVADGGSVKNVIFGTKIGDGIHCLGTCTIDNVWFPYICDDAVTMLGGSGKTATIKNSGFKGARDKTIQHNGDGSTVVLDNIYVETAGKLYRSCGQGGGCGPSSSKRKVNASNIYAIGVGQVIGVSTNDTATLKNICTYRTPQVCHTYQPGSDNDALVGANSLGEGPSANCVYTAADTHALLDHVTGSATTDVLCTGPNSAKTGSTATNCVSGFDTCLKNCAPGSYGFKQIACSGGKYADPGGSSCLMPADATAASKLAGTNTSMATSTVSNNSACTNQWAWASDGNGKYCVCVMKPGYYQESSGWYVWDCQSQWW